MAGPRRQHLSTLFSKRTRHSPTALGAGPNGSGTIHARRKSLTDLPRELILNVFSFVDSKALLRLTQTCHLLTSLSLDVFFRRHKIKPTPHTSASSRHTVTDRIDITSQRSNRLILSALCIASVTGACPDLFRSGRSIHWRAPGDNTRQTPAAEAASVTNGVTTHSDGWIKEVKHLKRLLSLNRRAQDGSLGFASVTMDFSRAVSFGGTRAQARMVNSRVILPWLKIIGGLLDVASRSTRCLRIVGGDSSVGSGSSRFPEIDLRSKEGGEEKGAWAWELDSTAMLGTWERGWRTEGYAKGFEAMDAAATERCWAITTPSATHQPMLWSPTLVRRLEVCDPSFLQNPTVYRWLMRWAYSSLA